MRPRQNTARGIWPGIHLKGIRLTSFGRKNVQTRRIDPRSPIFLSIIIHKLSHFLAPSLPRRNLLRSRNSKQGLPSPLDGRSRSPKLLRARYTRQLVAGSTKLRNCLALDVILDDGLINTSTVNSRLPSYAFQTFPAATVTPAIALRVSTMHWAQSPNSW